MRISNLIAASALLAGGAMAAPAGSPAHKHHRDKRAVVTDIVEAKVTVVVTGAAGPTTLSTGASVAYTTPEDSVSRAAPVPTSSVEPASSTAAASTSTAAPSSTSSAASASSEAPSSASSSSAPASTSSSSAPPTGNTGASGFRGISYTPYNADGSCKSLSEVTSDLAKLDGYANLRLYGVDCDQVSNVLQAKSDSQKLFVGIYFMDQISSGIQTLADAVEKYGSWDDIVTVSIGNELVNSGQHTPSDVSGFVDQGRSALTAAGYTGPVVAVDTFISVINNPELCKYSDYMAVNAHAYFDEHTTADNAGSWLLQQIQRVYEACGGEKDVIITESGWPTQGQTFGDAVASPANQKTAVSSILDVCGDDTYVFTAYNDLWKADGQYGVEKWFGILGDS